MKPPALPSPRIGPTPATMGHMFPPPLLRRSTIQPARLAAVRRADGVLNPLRERRLLRAAAAERADLDVADVVRHLHGGRCRLHATARRRRVGDEEGVGSLVEAVMVVQQKQGSPYLWIEVLDRLLVRVHADDYLPEPGPVDRLPIDRVRLHDVEELREVVRAAGDIPFGATGVADVGEEPPPQAVARANRDSRTASRAWRMGSFMREAPFSWAAGPVPTVAPISCGHGACPHHPHSRTGSWPAPRR